jgi:uncharacterized phage protein (TIGR01671 family)
MSRDILFKAKRIDNGEWVIGGTIVQFLDNGIRSLYMPQFNEKCDCTHDNSTDDILGFENCRFYKVDTSTICQYTGLTDKNGNKIWENDIIQYKGIKALGKVEYIEDSFYLKDVDDGKQYLGEMWNKFEVIGNIFDNPELLEGGA